MTFNSSSPVHKQAQEALRIFKRGMALVSVGGTGSENAPFCVHLKPY